MSEQLTGLAALIKAGDALSRRLSRAPGLDIMRGSDLDAWQEAKDAMRNVEMWAVEPDAPAPESQEADRLRDENTRLRDLYENVVGNRERFGFTINHLLECEEALRTVEAAATESHDLAEMARILTDPQAIRNALPPEEVAEYERCQQSVIDARRSAERNEGRRYIG